MTADVADDTDGSSPLRVLSTTPPHVGAYGRRLRSGAGGRGRFPGASDLGEGDSGRDFRARESTLALG